jgi:hypothetical protein
VLKKTYLMLSKKLSFELPLNETFSKEKRREKTINFMLMARQTYSRICNIIYREQKTHKKKSKESRKKSKRNGNQEKYFLCPENEMRDTFMHMKNDKKIFKWTKYLSQYAYLIEFHLSLQRL